jgi:hypothetical protein
MKTTADAVRGRFIKKGMPSIDKYVGAAGEIMAKPVVSRTIEEVLSPITFRVVAVGSKQVHS